MTYELAKELKDAGFPLVEVLVEHRSCFYCGTPFIEIDSRRYHCPTLSELIEACGEGLWTMRKGIYRGEIGWIVGQDTSASTDPVDWKIFAFGNSLDVAVARLWLALHSKA